MVRILHTIETRGPGGAEILLFNIAKFLKEKGYVNFGFFIKEGWLLDNFQRANFTSSMRPLNRSFNIPFLFQLLFYIKKHKIDVIHSHEMVMSFYSCLASILLRVPVVSTFHGVINHSDTKIRSLAMRFIAKHSSMVAVSKDVKKYILEKNKINNFKITVIENGIPIPDENHKGKLKDELGLSPESILVGTIGRLHPIKGHEILIKCAKMLSVDQRYFFVFAGDGEQKERFSKIIDDQGLSARIFMLGNRLDIDNILSSIDIFVLPSFSEGTSLALLEAMAHGVSIIATNVGNTPKIIACDSNNIVIFPGDKYSIYNAILEIVNSGKYKQKSTLNRNNVINNYSLESMVRKYMNLYN